MAADPISAWLSQWDPWVVISTLMFFVTIGLAFVALLIGSVYAFWRFSHPIKAVVVCLYGSGKANSPLTVGNVYTNRIKKTKDGRWKFMKPYFKTNYVKKFKEEHVYSGNNVIVFKAGDEYLSGSVDLQLIKGDNGFQGVINVVPENLRGWQSLKHKEHMLEFRKEDFWSENKQLIISFLTVLACLVTAIAAIWISYKMIQPTTQTLSHVASVFEGMTRQVIQ